MARKIRGSHSSAAEDSPCSICAIPDVLKDRTAFVLRVKYNPSKRWVPHIQQCHILEDLHLYTRILDHADHVLYTNLQWLTGAVVCRHHTRKILSMLPAANSVFSVFTAMSVISADAPRSVANRRPSITLHILTRRSSAPCREGSFMSLTFLGARNTITYLLELP